jgi:hypothetical protein
MSPQPERLGVGQPAPLVLARELRDCQRVKVHDDS